MFTNPAVVRKPGPSPLSVISSSLPNSAARTGPSPLSLISPPSTHSSGSGSSGSSSPASPVETTGPFTPSSAPLPHSFLSMPSHDFDTLLAEHTLFESQQHQPHSQSQGQTQAEIDLAAEMANLNAQPDFSAFSWSWPSDTTTLLDDNWDPSLVPSALLGEQANSPSHPENNSANGFNSKTDAHIPSAGLNFGGDFEGLDLQGLGLNNADGVYVHDPTLLGVGGGYDELMAGGAFN